MELRPKWCKDRKCQPLKSIKQCCIGKPLMPMIHDGIENDLCLCVDDGIGWYVNDNDLKVLSKLIEKVRAEMGEQG